MVNATKGSKLKHRGLNVTLYFSCYLAAEVQYRTCSSSVTGQSLPPWIVSIP